MIFLHRWGQERKLPHQGMPWSETKQMANPHQEEKTHALRGFEGAAVIRIADNIYTHPISTFPRL